MFDENIGDLRKLTSFALSQFNNGYTFVLYHHGFSKVSQALKHKPLRFVWVGIEVTPRCREICPAQVQGQSHNQIVDHGHCTRSLSAFQVTPIFTQGFISPIVQSIFNAPMASNHVQELSGTGFG